MIHLTETGLHAGRRLCLTERSDGQRNVHAAHAPLHLSDFRRDCCQQCLEIWANEAYDDGDEMPDYIQKIRRATAQQ
jgi:hypothetical protein